MLFVAKLHKNLVLLNNCLPGGDNLYHRNTTCAWFKIFIKVISLSCSVLVNILPLFAEQFDKSIDVSRFVVGSKLASVDIVAVVVLSAFTCSRRTKHRYNSIEKRIKNRNRIEIGNRCLLFKIFTFIRE